jgi:hypothetical protein
MGRGRDERDGEGMFLERGCLRGFRPYLVSKVCYVSQSVMLPLSNGANFTLHWFHCFVKLCLITESSIMFSGLVN